MNAVGAVNGQKLWPSIAKNAGPKLATADDTACSPFMSATSLPINQPLRVPAGNGASRLHCAISHGRDPEMQTLMNFEFLDYVRSVNDRMKQACGMTAYELVDQIWKDCFDHGLPPSEAVAMFLADNEHLFTTDD